MSSFLIIAVLFQIVLITFGGSIGTRGILTPQPLRCDREETGKIISIEVTSCSSGTIGSPCGLTAPFWYEFAVGFTPLISTEGVYMGLEFHPNGGESQILEEIHISGGFLANFAYRVTAEVQAPSQFAGKLGEMEVWLRTEGGGGGGNFNKSIINRCFQASIASI